IALLLDVVCVESKVRMLIVQTESVLPSDSLIRHVRKNVTNFRRKIQTFRVNFRTPFFGTEHMSVRIVSHLSRLLFVIHITNVEKSNPAFFLIGIWPAVHHIDLTRNWVVEETVVVHVVFRKTSISVNKETTAPFIRKPMIEVRV